jgi:hypothetical protein
MMSFEERTFPKLDFADRAVLEFCSQQTDYPKLNKEEKEFYYWVNYSRHDRKKFYDSIIVAIVKIYPQLRGEYLNILRSDLLKLDSLPLLAFNPSLIQMAKNHSDDITSIRPCLHILN